MSFQPTARIKSLHRVIRAACPLGQEKTVGDAQFSLESGSCPRGQLSEHMDHGWETRTPSDEDAVSSKKALGRGL